MSIFVNAIRNLSLNASWVCVGAELYENIDWQDNVNAKPSKEQVEAEITRLQSIADSENQTKINAKASALSKLSALGLTENEIKALVGIK
jgi:hypothetical protein